MNTVTTPQRIQRDQVAAPAQGAYESLLTLLGRLRPADWEAPTDCDAWDVAAMVGHMIGAAKGNALIRENVRQLVHGKRHAAEHGGAMLDALNALQVRDHADLTPTERIAAIRAWAPRAIAGRMRVPGVLRRAPVPLEPGNGSNASGLPATIPLGRLLDVVYTRDVWLHTVDIERATGVSVTRTADVDGVIVADAVADWMSHHGQPVRLVLTGPAGGTYEQGSGGETITIDAVEWARTVTKRAPVEHGLLATPVLF